MKISSNKYKSVRGLRICVSIAISLGIFIAVAFGYDIWLSRWQLIPAVMAGALLWVLMWIFVTAVVGRIYCSSVCPVGTLLDFFGWIGHRKHGYFFSQSRVLMRRSITCIAIIALLLGIPVMLDYLDPAAAFSRIAAWSLGPIVRPVAFSLGAGLVAFATVAALAATGLTRGRLICNTICPVGTCLAEISRFSLYHIDINTDKCIGCGLCTERCKAECIDPSAHTVDSARCILCFNCTAACPNSAITYRRGRHRLVMPMMQAADTGSVRFGSDSQNDVEANIDTTKKLDRRDFFATILAAMPAMSMASSQLDPDLEPLNPVHPPGLRSIESLRLRCTSCGACSTACPSSIIRPNDVIRLLRSPLRPVLEFDTGPCIYDCIRCTEVCPTGTLEALTVSEKHIFVIGKARVVPQFCLEYINGKGCGICSRRCPRQAISILPVEKPEAAPGHPADSPALTEAGVQRRLPQIDSSLCIGCGMCRYVCPSRPRAFIIEGEN